MGKITVITGGARSGKSRFAEESISANYKNVSYIATAKPYDEGMEDRIKKHVESRPKFWKTYEVYEEISVKIESIASDCQCILIDCVTIMLTNLMLNKDRDWDSIKRSEIDEIEEYILVEVDRLIYEIRKNKIDAFIVTNEVGSGIVPENRLARIFRDMAGRMNQKLANLSDEVYFVISGIPMKIK